MIETEESYDQIKTKNRVKETERQVSLAPVHNSPVCKTGGAGPGVWCGKLHYRPDALLHTIMKASH